MNTIARLLISAACVAALVLFAPGVRAQLCNGGNCGLYTDTFGHGQTCFCNAGYSCNVDPNNGGVGGTCCSPAGTLCSLNASNPLPCSVAGGTTCGWEGCEPLSPGSTQGACCTGSCQNNPAGGQWCGQVPGAYVGCGSTSVYCGGCPNGYFCDDSRGSRSTHRCYQDGVTPAPASPVGMTAAFAAMLGIGGVGALLRLRRKA